MPIHQTLIYPITNNDFNTDSYRANANAKPLNAAMMHWFLKYYIGNENNDNPLVFPDTNAELAGEKPQHVYSVRFTARELWGKDAPAQDVLYIDLWDDYLDPA